MIQTTRVTILIPDNAVYLDQGAYLDLDLSKCNVPQEIRALDWRNGKGELHHYDTQLHHIQITELPEWAMNCIAKWEEQYTQDQTTQEPILNVADPNNEPNT